MSRVVILGAGISGHTAAAYVRRWLGRHDTVTVISPNDSYNWVPSNIWVGIGLMKQSRVLVPLAPLYERHGIEFKQAWARAIHPEGDAQSQQPYVAIEHVGNNGAIEKVPYDFLINATGPKLAFDKTEGLGPDANSLSVCTAEHAVHTSAKLDEMVERMKRGERQRFLVGVGHGTSTCQGAAFEYIVNLEFELRRRKVRDKAEIIWISNEYELGDFGMDGMQLRHAGYTIPSKVFAESLYAERGIDWITRAHVQKMDEGRALYETLDGEQREQEFDFAMLIPPFTGVGLKAYDSQGADITSRMFLPNGFMKVDADYNPKPYEEWTAEDWPRTYQSPEYGNIFAAGIAFAPPHPISRPRTSPNGTVISPAPPRTGMPSASIGRAVAKSVADMVRGRSDMPTEEASMAKMGAACVASTGANPFTGSAASMTVFPIVPDYKTYPRLGRDPKLTYGELGLAGHWTKIMLHHMFLYKAKLRAGWPLIPE